MISALWTSAMGLMPSESNIDIIANNLANVNTSGFKKDVGRFQDFFYQSAIDLMESEYGISGQVSPIVGGGSLPAAHKVFDQGRLESTEEQLDIAIDGDGFFKVQLSDGTAAYTRDGSFRVDANRQIITPQGYKLVPSLIIPEGISHLSIDTTGEVLAKRGELEDSEEIGRITVYEVSNLDGLFAVGENLYLPSSDSGEIIEKVPGSDGAGFLRQGFLESSNVDVAEEFAKLVIAHRAYDLSAKALKTSDEMIATTMNIRG